MTPKKKEASNTESSTASSTDSTTSSSSSSGSDSGSSSSDSDSSSSQDDTRPSGSAQTKKSTPRRSTDTAPNKTNPAKNELDKQANKPKPDKAQQKTPVKSKSVAYSSEEDLTTKTNKNANTTTKRKATPVKPKSNATVTPKPKPTILKSGEVINKQNPTRKITDKPNISTSISNAKNKKKSIFSPDNSSDSDDSAPQSKQTTKTANSRACTARTKDKPVSKPKALPARTKPSPKAISVTKPGNKSVGRPRRNSSRRNSKSKNRESSVSSIASNSGSTSDSGSSSVTNDDRNDRNNDCHSDSSESSEASIPVPPPTKKPARRNQLSKTQSSSSVVTSSKANTKPVPAASESDDSKRASVTRKFTRSSSTRKSKHLTGKAPSDTESDGCDSGKRSASKSPVKRSSVAAKAPGKNKRPLVGGVLAAGSKRRVSPPPEERKCPLEGCDSAGHLGGVYEKHFTIEACPVYHNTTMAQCKQLVPEWKKQEEERVKAIANLDKEKKGPTPEQKQYQLKIKEMRSKFKATNESKSAVLDKDREPSLAGVACDYDLKLFREAQALASVAIEDELKELPVTRGTRYVSMGKYCMEVWYQSPYPDDVARLPKLYLCEFCLRYQKSSVGMTRHAAKCVWRHPPGEEVYRKNRLGVWQVDGKRHKQYCQHLCLLAKFFLDHKTLYYDVEPFLFYVMTLTDSEGAHTVGYFSKEKNSFLNYNVSCILTLPPYQRQGYGRLLIDFSYLLTRTEGKIGSPEKPLSDLGLISYRSYWKDVLLAYLCSRDGTTLCVKDVSQEMAINSYDIVSTLQALGMMKYWKGKHIILKKLDVLEEYADRVKRRGSVREIDPACLRWSPFVPPANPGGGAGGASTPAGNAAGAS